MAFPPRATVPAHPNGCLPADGPPRETPRMVQEPKQRAYCHTAVTQPDAESTTAKIGSDGPRQKAESLQLGAEERHTPMKPRS